jgi:hypothetical protein
MTDKTTAQTRRSFLKSTGAVGGAVACGLRPATLLAKARKQTLLKDGDLETAIKILNLFSEKSEIVNKLYRAIYAALQASPTTRFEAVSKDETVQALCQELNRNHLGGPMLGNLKEDGASVWVRTLNPATALTRCCIGEPGLVVKHCGNELFMTQAQLRTNATISHYRQRVEQV